MSLKELLKNSIVYLDGGLGTLLQSRGLMPGEHPESWNITHPEDVIDIHRSYFDAGSNVVCTDTFGANSLKFNDDELEQIIKAAIGNVRKAMELSSSEKEKFVALDIGSLGKLLKPFGELDFEDAVSIFAKTIRLGAEYGADLIFIETMNDCYETKAALLAAKENCNLPVFVSNAYSENGRLMTGASPEAMAAMLESMGADAIGMNCSLGPDKLRPVAEKMVKATSLPVVFKPNAGIPSVVDGKTVFNVEPEEFAREVKEAVRNGVRLVGGCCGTTPEYIRAVVDAVKDIEPVPLTKKNDTVISSGSDALVFAEKPILIGERINPTGKKLLKQALRDKDMSYILKEGLEQKARGADVLDVNTGLPDIDEKEMLTRTVCELQGVCDLPLQIDTTDIAAMESALRRYNGKALINSVNGKEESMAQVFPLVRKYGGTLIALTLDEKGIPSRAEDRVEIAKKIIAKAAEYGIGKKDIIFDPLALTVSADSEAANETIKAVRDITALGCKTSLGVSNVSFGLPNRDFITSIFFARALENGLSAAIMNPFSDRMMETFYSFCALSGIDKNCTEYIEFCGNTQSTVEAQKPVEGSTDLADCIIKGLRDKAAAVTSALLGSNDALDIVNEKIIPALDETGKSFEQKKIYLPQLLMSAEAAQAAFEKIKEVLSEKSEKTVKAKFVLATVKGDIHDIGKNIVKLLLENYGYDVYDLGKDVPASAIVEKTVELHAPFVGLSALMTTTVPAMEETIKELRVHAPWCRVIVGGAVLTQEYADMIGADKYSADAMETVRYVESFGS